MKREGMRAKLLLRGVYDSKLRETPVAAVLLSSPKLLLDILLSLMPSQLDKIGHVQGGMAVDRFQIRKTSFPSPKWLIMPEMSFGSSFIIPRQFSWPVPSVSPDSLPPPASTQHEDVNQSLARCHFLAVTAVSVAIKSVPAGLWLLPTIR